jgi:hypothetical protein
MATGLLIITTGAGTKFSDDFMGMDKTYSGSVTMACTGGYPQGSDHGMDKATEVVIIGMDTTDPSRVLV